MINNVVLMGRLTKDPEVRYGQGAQGTAVAKYTLAVNRTYKRDGEPDADFISCVAFNKTAEFAGKYFRKGMMVGIVGSIRTGSYEAQDGTRRYTTDIVVREQSFAEKKEQNGYGPQNAPAPQQGPYNQNPYQQPTQPPRGAQRAPQQPQAMPQQYQYQQMPQQMTQQMPQLPQQMPQQYPPQQEPAVPPEYSQQQFSHDEFMPDYDTDEDLPF